MAGLSTGAGSPVVKVYHEKSMILPDVSRVLACLYEKDIKFERVKDSYKDILGLQASRSVPVPFYDGPTFLQESRAICRYIAETYKQRGYPFLLGKDVLERASIEQWLRHEEHAFNPPSRALFCHLAFPLHDEDNDDINREKRELEEVLEVYEQRLGESEFLAGKKFTLADLVHLPNTHHIVTSEKFAYLYDSRKNVQRWWNTISARDSWQQVLRDMKSVEEQYQREESEKQQQQQQEPSDVQEPGPPDIRAPPSTPKQTPTDDRNSLAPVQEAAPGGDDISDKQSDKSTMDERAQGMTPRQAPPSDTPRTSASIQEAIQGAHPSDDMLGKTSGTDQIATPAAPTQTPTQGAVPDVHDTGDDTTKKPAVSISQETTEPIKGFAPTSHDITGDNSAKIANVDESATSPALVKGPASDGRIASTDLKGGTLDAQVKNEAVKPSGADPRGMPTTPRRPAPTPDTQRGNTSDQASGQSPPLPPFADTRNEKTGIAEAGQTNTIAPNEQPGGGVPKNAGAPAAGPSPMKSQKNMNETSIQQLSSDQSRAQPAENKKKQGDDATLLTEIGKAKEEDFLANDKQKSTGQAQETSTDGPSKLQMQSDQNKPISSKEIVKRDNETSRYRSSAPSREMSPSVPEESMREQQLQGDRSSISPQDNVRQGSEAALPVSGTEQPKKRDLTNADQNSGKTSGETLQKSDERTSSETPQVKRNTSNSKSDGSSNPTQFDGNEGNIPEAQSRGSSTNP